METFESVMNQIIRGICIASGLFYSGLVFAAISKLMGV
jgi:hypothetical protein